MAVAERRKYMRFNTVLHGGYELPDGQTKGRSEIKNLSREGIRILVDKQITSGTEIDLTVDIPGDNVPIYARAQVAWNKKLDSGEKIAYATGLKFTKIDRFDRARLLDYVYTQWMRFLKKEV
jgi:c-di-GMP-binding flagellar brake protein YcgR